jgi:LysM repeat protein
MKKLTALAWIGILLFGAIPISAYAANGSVDSISATYTDGSGGSAGTIAYSGTVADTGTTKAVAILILKGEGNSAQLILMDTCEVRNDRSFSSSISVKLTEAGTYTIQASDYEGGAFASTTFIVNVETTPTPTTPTLPTAAPTEVIEKEAEIVIKDTVAKEDVPDTKLDINVNEIKEGILTAEEQARMDAGEPVAVYLEVKDIKETVSKEEKAKIEEVLGEDTIGLFLDIKLIKQIGDDKPQEVSKTNEKIKISIKIPEELLVTEEGKQRIYKIVTIHEGEVTILEGTFDKETGLFTFETDKFSTYALVYSDIDLYAQWVQLYETMYIGEKKEFTFDSKGYDLDNIIWRTSEKAIATVAKNKGKNTATVTAKSIGEDTIYLQYDNDKILSLVVSVVEETASWVKAYETMKVGEKKVFSFDQGDRDLDEVIWKTSEKGIAVVGKNQGKAKATVTAKSIGTDTLYLQSEKNKFLKLTITIIDDKDDEEPTKPTLPAGKKETTYIVKKGDTLWVIAKKYNTTVKEIVDNNNIINQNHIVIGQKLKIITNK